MAVKCKYHYYILPLVLLLCIIIAYFIYIIFCIQTINSVLESMLYILFINILLIFLLWCFLYIVFTPVATVPLKYKLTDEEIDVLNSSDNANKNLILNGIITERNLIVQTRFPADNIRYCLKCKQIKPDRARHCSSCGMCVLKMDHHCPWVNNCIGFSNYKSFTLFLFYMVLYCLYFICTSFKYFLIIMNNKESQVAVFSYVLVACYGLIGATVLIYQCSLLSKNETSIDKLQKPIIVVENATYNIGCRRNFVEVFGNNWRLWPFPIFTSLGSGCVFPVRILQNNHSNV